MINKILIFVGSVLLIFFGLIYSTFDYQIMGCLSLGNYIFDENYETVDGEKNIVIGYHPAIWKGTDKNYYPADLITFKYNTHRETAKTQGLVVGGVLLILGLCFRQK